jgi:hypothetical protein
MAGLLPGLVATLAPTNRIEGGDPMRTAKKISSIELSDWQGQRVRLETLWKEQPIVLVFIRHFG